MSTCAPPKKQRRPNARHELPRLRLPFRSAQGGRRVNLTAHGYFDFATTFELGHASSTMMAAGFGRSPSRRGYRARKDDIAPIASASAMPSHHSRNQSPPRKSKPRPRLPSFGMSHVCRNVPPALIFIFSLRRLQDRQRRNFCQTKMKFVQRGA
jgi:hypothetical protein